MNYKYTKPIPLKRGEKFSNNFWTFESRKLNRVVSVFNNLEYENIISLEMDHNVEWYCEYPVETTVFTNGRENKIVLNTWVLYKDGTECFQIVSYETTNDMDYRNDKTEALCKWCGLNDLNYQVITYDNVTKGKYYIRNLNFLATKARRYIPASPADDRLMLDYFRTVGRVSIGFIRHSGKFKELSLLNYLADYFYRGQIDFIGIEDSPITDDTEVLYIGIKKI